MPHCASFVVLTKFSIAEAMKTPLASTSCVKQQSSPIPEQDGANRQAINRRIGSFSLEMEKSVAFWSTERFMRKPWIGFVVSRVCRNGKGNGRGVRESGFLLASAALGSARPRLRESREHF